MEKALGETQTLHAGHSNAEPKIFAPQQTPFPGAQGGQILINWRWSLSLIPTNPVWWGSMYAISIYRGNRPTNTKTHPPIDMTDYNTLRHSFDSAQCNNAFVIRFEEHRIFNLGRYYSVLYSFRLTTTCCNNMHSSIHRALATAQCNVIGPVCLCVCGGGFVFVGLLPR